MDPASFIREQWHVISSYPLTFVLLSFVTASLAVAITRAVMGGALEASRERLMAAKDEISNLKVEKDTLIEKLRLHGDDIAALKVQLNALPKIHIGTEPPQQGQGKDGDIYVVFEK